MVDAAANPIGRLIPLAGGGAAYPSPPHTLTERRDVKRHQSRRVQSAAISPLNPRGGGRQGVKHDRVKKGGFNLKCRRICFILCNLVFIAVKEFYVTTAIKSRHWRSLPLNVSRLSVLCCINVSQHVARLSETLLKTISASYGNLYLILNHRGLSSNT